MVDKQRLDVALVKEGLVESRSKAKELIRAGRVMVGSRAVNKPSYLVSAEDELVVSGPAPYVGRAAKKLLGALDAFGVDPADRVWADVGAGAGGFSQVLLERGASLVYAIDVGHNQLHSSLRQDPCVVVMEGVNARHLQDLPRPVGGVVMDVSFISSTIILPNIFRWLVPGGVGLVLVKPQFELEPGLHRGVVRDPVLQRRALERVGQAAQAIGFVIGGESESPLPGRQGNREFWLYLKK